MSTALSESLKLWPQKPADGKGVHHIRAPEPAAPGEAEPQRDTLPEVDLPPIPTDDLPPVPTAPPVVVTTAPSDGKSLLAQTASKHGVELDHVGDGLVNVKVGHFPTTATPVDLGPDLLAEEKERLLNCKLAGAVKELHQQLASHDQRIKDLDAQVERQKATAAEMALSGTEADLDQASTAVAIVSCKRAALVSARRVILAKLRKRRQEFRDVAQARWQAIKDLTVARAGQRVRQARQRILDAVRPLLPDLLGAMQAQREAEQFASVSRWQMPGAAGWQSID